MSDRLKRSVLIIWLPLILAACNDKGVVVTYTLPYIQGCDLTLERASRFLVDSTKNKDYSLSLEVAQFDYGQSLGSRVKGIVTLTSIGDWNTLSGKTPLEYLELQASSISAECMANNYVSAPFMDIGNTYSDLIRSYNDVIPLFENGKLVFVFNDGEYRNPNW